MLIKYLKNIKFLGCVLAMFLASCLYSNPPTSSAQDLLQESQTPSNQTNESLPQLTDDTIIPQLAPTSTDIYLPLLQDGKFPTFLGIIMPVYWNKENVAKYMPEADALAGKKHTAVGWGIDVQDPALYEPWQTDHDLNKNNLYRQLEQLWLQGYVSFIKIGSSTTIRPIADGYYDDRLNQMAQLYKRWLENGGGRKAMFAPFQEMNGEWVPYYSKDATPSQKQKDFKDAYLHIMDIFQRNGIDRSKIWWVFSPNGWSWPEDNFEYYYPGHEFVDLVGFAAYNFGFCEATVKEDKNDYGYWENYDRIYKPYIERMQALAPSKPILITETGTSALASREAQINQAYDYALKAEWLSLNYNYLREQPMVLGIFYFDFNDLGHGVTCDLGIPRTNFSGYKEAVAHSSFKYIKGTDLDEYIP